MTRITKAPDERRGELINAAQVLFFSKGYEKTSINDIVKAVGVAKGLFYYYFDSKQAILEALVANMTGQIVMLVTKVIETPNLSAVEKWEQMYEISSAWKAARKDELLTIIRVIMHADNVRLRHAMIKRQHAMVAPLYAKMIAQGVEEGVFNTPFVEDSAEIILAIYESSRNFLSDILLNPHNYPNGRELVAQKLHAMQTAVERVLGAAPGTLSTPLIADKRIDTWFS